MKLQKLLQQPATTQISVVSILAQLAFAETRDLIAACQRLNLTLSRLFLNQLTSNNANHSRSKSLSEEHYWKLQYQHVFPDLPQILVYTGYPPIGIDTLSLLGQQLYQE